jgi:hypothetical protein
MAITASIGIGYFANYRESAEVAGRSKPSAVSTRLSAISFQRSAKMPLLWRVAFNIKAIGIIVFMIRKAES